MNADASSSPPAILTKFQEGEGGFQVGLGKIQKWQFGMFWFSYNL
jgi:hypothetical protein